MDADKSFRGALSVSGSATVEEWERSRAVLLATSCFSVLVLVGALVAQYVFGLEPCPWCIVQRMGYVVVWLGALLGSMWRSSVVRMAFLRGLLVVSVVGLLVALSAVVGLALGVGVGSSCVGSIANSVVEGSRLDLLVPWLFEVRGGCAGSSVGVAVALNAGSACGYMGLVLLFCWQLRRSLLRKKLTETVRDLLPK